MLRLRYWQCNAFVAVTFALLTQPQAQAVLSFTVSGFASTNNVPLETYRSSSGSAAVSVDMGKFFRIGLTHRQQFETKDSFRLLEDGAITDYVTSTHITTNSLDLTIVLYSGEIFVPYIFGGLAVKKYVSRATGQTGKEDSYPAPIGGAGFGMRLNKQFMLKFFHTLSPGFRQDPGDPEPVSVLDRYSQVGISYHL